MISEHRVYMFYLINTGDRDKISAWIICPI